MKKECNGWANIIDKRMQDKHCFLFFIYVILTEDKLFPWSRRDCHYNRNNRTTGNGCRICKVIIVLWYCVVHLMWPQKCWRAFDGDIKNTLKLLTKLIEEFHWIAVYWKRIQLKIHCSFYYSDAVLWVFQHVFFHYFVMKYLRNICDFFSVLA